MDNRLALDLGEDEESEEPDGGPAGDDDAGRRLLAQIYGADGPPDMEAFAGPLHWPAVPAADLADIFAELRAWVAELTARFPPLDHTVIPSCWWRHPGHIEALQALKDHERVSYADSSPGTAGVEWHRALALIESRLREWTAWSGCANGHRDPITQLHPTDEAAWEAHVRAEVEWRRRQETTTTLPAATQV